MITIKNRVTSELKLFDNPASARLFIKDNTDWYVKSSSDVSRTEMWWRWNTIDECRYCNKEDDNSKFLDQWGVCIKCDKRRG